jgi:hypothetical protein
MTYFDLEGDERRFAQLENLYQRFTEFAMYLFALIVIQIALLALILWKLW